MWAGLADRSLDSIATISNCLALAKNTLDVATKSATITHKTNSIYTSSSNLSKGVCSMSFTPDIARAANGMALGDNRRTGPELADLAETGGPVAVKFTREANPHNRAGTT